eukprot:UN34414
MDEHYIGTMAQKLNLDRTNHFRDLATKVLCWRNGQYSCRCALQQIPRTIYQPISYESVYSESITSSNTDNIIHPRPLEDINSELSAINIEFEG